MKVLIKSWRTRPGAKYIGTLLKYKICLTNDFHMYNDALIHKYFGKHLNI